MKDEDIKKREIEEADDIMADAEQTEAETKAEDAPGGESEADVDTNEETTTEEERKAKEAEEKKAKEEKAKREKEEKEKEKREKEEKEVESLALTIQNQAREDEQPLSKTLSFRKILGGDFFTAEFMKKNVGVIVLIVGFTLVYIANRYSCQNDLLEIDRLNKVLQDSKYKALSAASELTEKCRETHVLEMLRNNKDSVLKQASQPPYIINVEEK
ncbi:MAG: FtsL-like putative cell division protein [Prevotella sp.]|nr:FtsL-like putative cell division protein [Prevotella sp.]